MRVNIMVLDSRLIEEVAGLPDSLLAHLRRSYGMYGDVVRVVPQVKSAEKLQKLIVWDASMEFRHGQEPSRRTSQNESTIACFCHVPNNNVTYSRMADLVGLSLETRNELRISKNSFRQARKFFGHRRLVGYHGISQPEKEIKKGLAVPENFTVIYTMRSLATGEEATEARTEALYTFIRPLLHVALTSYNSARSANP